MTDSRTPVHIDVLEGPLLRAFAVSESTIEGIDMLYWRLSTSDNRSLFSVDVDIATRTIVGFELAIFRGNIDGLQSGGSVQESAGQVVVDITIWPPRNDSGNAWRFLENENSIKVQRDGSIYRIELIDSPCSRRIAFGDCAFLELNERQELIAVRVALEGSQARRLADRISGA